MIDGLLAGMARQLATPHQRAYWATYLSAMAWCGLRRIPTIPSFLISVLAAEAVKKAWLLAGHVERIADALDDPVVVFGGEFDLAEPEDRRGAEQVTRPFGFAPR